MMSESDLVNRLRKMAEDSRSMTQMEIAEKVSDLLEEAAREIEVLRNYRQLYFDAYKD
jgi:hypothetical protein